MAKKSTTPASTHETTTPAAEKKKYKSYPMMHITISKQRTELHDKLDKLATSLGCRANDLVWQGIEHITSNPPKTAPIGAVRSVGSAPGFWVVPDLSGKGGKAVGVNVVHVANRGQIEGGRTFFRYESGDEKSKNRAQAQALRAAQYDLKMLGLPSDQVGVSEAAAD